MRYNLRTLLLGLTVLLIWLGWKADHVHRQRRAVAAIEAKQGAVEFCSPANGLGLPRWFGRDVACEVEAAYLGGTAIADDDLACLNGLPRLRVLVLTSTAVSDAGLRHLRDLHCLETIDLRFTAVSDAGVSALRQALPAAQVLSHSDID